MKSLLLLLSAAAILLAQAPYSSLLRWGRYRGANINHQFTDADAKVLAGWGANVVRINFHQLPLMRKQPPYDIDMEAVGALDRILDTCERNRLKAIIDPHTTPGTQGVTTTLPTDPIWRDFAFHDHLIRLWRFLAQRYKDRGEVIAGYDLLNEPSPPRGAGTEGTPADWNLLVSKLTAAIRASDTRHTLVVEFPIFANAPGGLPPVEEMVGYLRPIEDHNTVYSVHWYGPGEFTHQGVDGRPLGLRYPGFYRNTTWNADLHRRLLEPVAAFQHRYNVPIYLGEFAAARWAGDDGNRWMRDVAAIAERYGWSWTYHSFRIASVWDAEKSNTQADDEQRYETTPRIEMLREFFARNRARAPQLVAIVDGASFRSGTLAPLQIFTIFTDHPELTEQVSFRMDAAGGIARSLAGIEVLFDQTPAPLLYVSPRQIGGVVPRSVTGLEEARVTLRGDSGSASRSVAITESAPGLFTADGTGRGQVTALNDDGSTNAPDRPAARASVVSLFATGGGLFEAEQPDGAVATGANRTRLTVRLLVGGQPAEVLYAGAAPGMAGGVLQVNARLTSSAPAGPAVPVVLEVGSAVSQPGTTLAIR